MTLDTYALLSALIVILSGWGFREVVFQMRKSKKRHKR